MLSAIARCAPMARTRTASDANDPGDALRRKETRPVALPRAAMTMS
jgi:hypothetical protein